MLSGKRKTVGAFLCKAYSLFDSAVYAALEKEATRLNYNVVIFTTVGYFASQNFYDMQEKRMFSFAPIEHLDGILMAPDTYEIEGFKEELLEAVKERARCPVVTIRHKSDELDCVHTDEEKAIMPLLRHLLDDHGLKRIRFLAGYEGHPDSEARVKAYRTAMQEHGLTVDDKKDICHGNMWYNCGPEAYRILVGEAEEKPEAVVCANDYMAAGLIKEILNHGLRVPEDIVVTGFDNVPNLNLDELKVTTVEQDFTGMTVEAFRELDRQIRSGDSRTARDHNVSIGVPGQLVLSESCGCGKRDSAYFTAINKENAHTLDVLHNREVGMTYLSIEMGGCDDVKQMHRVLIEKKSDTPDLQDLYVCLFQNGKNAEGEPIFAKEMTDTMCLVHVMKDKQDCGMPMVSFDKSQLLPALAERNEPQVLYLMMLHQNENAYGYAVYHYYPGCIPSNFFQHWNVILSGALSNIHKRNELLELYEERRLSSITDVMTHLLNRRGLEEKLQPDWHTLCARKTYVSFVSFDLDNLKQINDHYGHLAGDYAIRAMGSALRNAAPKDAMAARMGGDEFLAVLPGADQRAAAEFLRRFEKELDAINKREKRSFQVEASYGSYVVRLDEMTSMEDCMRLSDEAMYRAKEERHAGR